MFKDKELHAGLALLINRFADFCIANNESTKNISTNFQYIGDQLAAFEGKLTDIQQLQDKLDNQTHTIIAVVDERNSYRQQLEEALKASEDWRLAALGRGDTLVSQARTIESLTFERDTLQKKLYEYSLEKSSAKPVQPAQPAGFNIQELANELSKYLTAPAVVEDTGLPTIGFDSPNLIQNFAPPAPSTGMGQDYGSNLMLSSGTTYSTASSGDTAGGNSVGVAASVLQPRSYIPSPSTSEPDAILADNILAADPEVMARIPKTPGPVLLPSQAQYAYQVAELVADGAQYLPPVPTVPTQG